MRSGALKRKVTKTKKPSDIIFMTLPIYEVLSQGTRTNVLFGYVPRSGATLCKVWKLYFKRTTGSSDAL